MNSIGTICEAFDCVLEDDYAKNSDIQVVRDALAELESLRKEKERLHQNVAAFRDERDAAERNVESIKAEITTLKAQKEAALELLKQSDSEIQRIRNRTEDMRVSKSVDDLLDALLEIGEDAKDAETPLRRAMDRLNGEWS